MRSAIGFGGGHEPLVLFVGRMTWQKRPDLLLGAVPDVLRHRPDARFAFVGDGDMRSALEGQAGAAGLFHTVRFLGARAGSELVGLFKSADVVCVPSRNEPFGIVVLERWSATQPVVVTANGGPREFVKDQETGWVVEPDRHALGWGIGAALDDRANARRIAANGRREAETRFSWDSVGARWRMSMPPRDTTCSVACGPLQAQCGHSPFVDPEPISFVRRDTSLLGGTRQAVISRFGLNNPHPRRSTCLRL